MLPLSFICTVGVYRDHLWIGLVAFRSPREFLEHVNLCHKADLIRGGVAWPVGRMSDFRQTTTK